MLPPPPRDDTPGAAVRALRALSARDPVARRQQASHASSWHGDAPRARALPGCGRDDPVVVVLQPLPQALVGRRPDQLEAYRTQARVDVGQLTRDLARRHLDLDHSVATLLERAKHQGAALSDRRLEGPEQVWRPETNVLDAFAALLQKLAPLARLAWDRLDQLEGKARPC